LTVLDEVPNEVYRVLLSAVILAAIAVSYKLLSRFLSRTGERLELEPHAMNALRLLLRVVTVISSLYVVFTVFKIPTTIFVGGSALIGAFLGFGSSQTINNIVAGFYVLITQPFKVKDYVKIGELEGQVEEITVNYTNLYTPTFNLLKVPNTQVMNSRVLNLTHEGFIKHTFIIGFDHGIPAHVIMDQCIQPAIDEFHAKHRNKQLRRPEAYLEAVDRLAKSFLIRIFIPKGEAKTLYVLEPELRSMITERWDELRKQ